MNALLETLKNQLRRPKVAIAAGAAAGVVIAVIAFGVFALTRGGGESKPLPPVPEPAEFTVSPSGDEVPRLAPIKVTFQAPPSERDGAKLVSLEPAVKGQYAWLGERTLLFQPDYPGLLRGQEYTINVGARPEAGLQQKQAVKFTTTGKLVVQSVIPADGDTDVPANGQVLIQFSRSVAALTTLAAQDTRQPVAFDPPLQGTGRWLNTSLYQFTPSALAPNTAYKATIAAGLTSAADGVLEKDFTWSFTSFGPAVDQVTPDDNTKFGAPNQPVSIVFNQPMNRASVEEGFSLVPAAGGAKVAGTFAWSEGGKTVTFTPSGQLARGGTYTAKLEAGRKGETGGETKLARTSTFSVVQSPGVARTDPANGTTSVGRYGFTITFTNPMDPDSFDGLVSISGIDKDSLRTYWYGDYNPSGTGAENVYMNVGVSLLPSTKYTVNIAAGGKDRYGQPFPAYSFSFTTGALEPLITFAIPNTIATYSAGAEPILYYHAMNTPATQFSLYRLTTEEAGTLQAWGYLPGKDQFKPSAAPMRQWTETNPATKDQVFVLSTSLSGGGTLPKGSYYVSATGGDWLSIMAFTVVDTAIVLKTSADELVAWAIDHDTGRPVSGLTLLASSIEYTNGPPRMVSVGTTTTDANGLATWKIPTAIGAWPPPQKNYVVQTLNGGTRSGIANMQWQFGTSLYQAGIQQEWYQPKYVGHLYTERPIYRPGEEVLFKGVLRLDDDAAYTIPSGAKDVRLRIHDAQGKEIMATDVQLNEFGSFSGSFTLASDASIGDYGVSLNWEPQGGPQYGGLGVAGTSFMVAEFRKPEFQVEVGSGKPSYANGDTIDASVNADYFFGGGVEHAKVEWSVLSRPFQLFVKGYEQYSFGEYNRWEYFQQVNTVRDPVRASGTAITDASGKATFSVPATLKGDEGAQEFQLTANVSDTSGQAVGASKTVTVHAASLYAGIKPEDYVAEVGQETKVSLVSVDTDGKPQANKAITVNVYERTWVTTKEATPEGARRYKSTPVDKILTTLKATTNDKGEGSVSYKATKTGTIRFVAEITDDKGRTAKSAAYLYVWGGGFASWRITNDDMIQLVADKPSYQVGETAQLLVPAPFSGATGLVTVERGKIISREVRAFETNSTSLSIPITARDLPNVYVSVALYRPPTAEDPVPRYKVGYVELPVSTSTRVLKVDIKPDRDQAKPGDKVKYDIKVTDSTGKGVKAELSVAVVDKAVLSLAEERTQSGLKAFWFERGLGVTTASSLAVSINRSNDVIAEPRRGGKGGGGLDDERLRQDFRNTAYWNPQLVTNADGTASVEVTMPDNLTTWRLQAIAISGDTLVGDATNELVSTQPLLLRPALPRFLRVGDNATIRLLVRNATKETKEFAVTLAAEGVDIQGGLSKSVKVEPNTSGVVTWPAKVSAEGTAKFTFSAKGGGLSDAITQEIPIYLDVTPEATATGGVVTNETLLEAIYLPNFAILEHGILGLTVQPTLTGSLAGELWYFRPYPERWESSVYIASRIIATLGVMRGEKSMGVDVSAREKQVKSDLAALLGRQRGDGGFTWCRNCPDSDEFVTTTVLHAFGEAKRDKFDISEDAVGRDRTYLSTPLNRAVDVQNPASPSEKAYVLYAFATAADPKLYLSSMRALEEQYRAQLSNWGRAYLIMGMAAAGVTKDDPQMGQLLNDLTAQVIPSANGNHWEDGTPKNQSTIAGRYYSPGRRPTHTTALVLDALVRADPQHPLIEETVRWLSIARSTEDWGWELERAETIVALSEFAAQTGELAANFAWTAKLDDHQVAGGTFARGDAVRQETAKVPLKEIGTGKVNVFSLAREANAPGRLYYMLTLRYLTPAQDVEAVNRGFAVSHEYSLLDKPGEPISKAKVGDTVRVKVTVMVPDQKNYVLLEDFLPAGLEPIEPKLKTTDPKLIAQLENERKAAARPEQADYWAPWWPWYYSPWNQTDMRDDRVQLRARVLPKGVHEFTYYARATTPGDYFVAPTHIEEGFFPDVFGRSDSSRFTVEP